MNETEEKKDSESILFTKEQILNRGIYWEGWDIVPSNNISPDEITGIFRYYPDYSSVLIIGWSMQIEWPGPSERPFIEWMALEEEENVGFSFVVGEDVKYCISSELLSMIQKTWEERKEEFI